MSFYRQYSNQQLHVSQQSFAENNNNNEQYQMMEFQAPNFKEEDEQQSQEMYQNSYDQNLRDYQQQQQIENFQFQQQQQQNISYNQQSPNTSDFYSQDDTQILHESNNNNNQCPQIQYGIYSSQYDEQENYNCNFNPEQQQQNFDNNDNINEFNLPYEEKYEYINNNNFSFTPTEFDCNKNDEEREQEQENNQQLQEQQQQNFNNQENLQQQQQQQQHSVKLEIHHHQQNDFDTDHNNLSTDTQHKSLNLVQDKKEDIFNNLLMEIRQNSHRKIHQYHSILKNKGIKMQSEKQLGRDINFIKKELSKKPELTCTELLLIYHRKPNRMKIPLPHNHREQVEKLLEQHGYLQKSKQLKKNDFIKFLNDFYEELPAKIPKDSKYPQLYFKGLYKQNPRSAKKNAKSEDLDNESMTTDDNIGQYFN